MRLLSSWPAESGPDDAAERGYALKIGALGLKSTILCMTNEEKGAH